MKRKAVRFLSERVKLATPRGDGDIRDNAYTCFRVHRSDANSPTGNGGAATNYSVALHPLNTKMHYFCVQNELLFEEELKFKTSSNFFKKFKFESKCFINKLLNYI